MIWVFYKTQRYRCCKQNRQIAEAKQVALQLAEQGYTQPIKEKVKVLGQDALGMFYVGTDQMLAGRYISEHDKK